MTAAVMPIGTIEDPPAVLRDLVEQLPVEVRRLFVLPGVRPCTACGRPCSHAKTGRPPGVLRLHAQGRCTSCNSAGREPVAVLRVRIGPPPGPRAHDIVRDERPGRRCGIKGPEWGALDLDGAACAGVGHDPFTVPDGSLGKTVPPEAVDAARRYCARCPVLDACDRFAREHRETGLWGGLWRPVVGKPHEIRTKTNPRRSKR